MAGHKKVEVDKVNLANYINELNQLYNDNCHNTKNTNKVSDLGNTAKMLQVVEDNYAGMTSSLLNLIKTFSNIMENALDGMIDIDETNAEMMDRLGK